MEIVPVGFRVDWVGSVRVYLGGIAGRDHDHWPARWLVFGGPGASSRLGGPRGVCGTSATDRSGFV